MAETRELPPISRLSTGIPGLDAVLNGGLLVGGLYIVLGTPGAGKTILANQIGFHHAAGNGRVVYITLLAESHARMLAHLQMMRFFDQKQVSQRLLYLSAYRTLKDEGLRGLLQFVRQTVREQRAALLVLDGFVTVEQFSRSEVDYKQFVHELNIFLETVDCTGLLLTQDAPDGETVAAHTMVDGLIELRDVTLGLRAVRELRVQKFRGSSHLRGYHLFEITDDGITVYPRAETVYNQQPVPLVTNPRVGFGLPELDRMLRGGVPQRSSTLALGLPGSGKTMLGVHFLAEGVAAGESGVLLGFSETPEDLAALAASLGLPWHSDAARAEVVWQLAGEQVIDRLGNRLLNAVAQIGARRVVIDSLNALQAASLTPDRVGTFLAALLNELRARNVTTLVSMETQRILDPNEDSSRLGISAMVDNIVLLGYERQGMQLQRELSIVKMRRSSFDPGKRTFAVTDQGLVVSRPEDDQTGDGGGVAAAPIVAAPKRQQRTRRRWRRS